MARGGRVDVEVDMIGELFRPYAVVLAAIGVQFQLNGLRQSHRQHGAAIEIDPFADQVDAAGCGGGGHSALNISAAVSGTTSTVKTPVNCSTLARYFSRPADLRTGKNCTVNWKREPASRGAAWKLIM